jgi:hypothetical protein
MTVYKIRRKKDGFFSTGKPIPTFTKSGKTWGKLQHLSCHLGNAQWLKEKTYENCDIVTFEIVEVSTKNVITFLSEKSQKKHSSI